MREVQRSAIVPYSPAQMFALVEDFERYPEFVPGCTGAELLDRQSTELTGRLTMAVGPVNGSFTTRNTLDPPSSMPLELVDGPFSELNGCWHFRALGDAGCEISLEMRFAFADPMKDMLLGAAFEQSCNKLVDAFVQRAAVIYG